MHVSMNTSEKPSQGRFLEA